jgi:excisionase family DNA binding protein
VSNFWFRRSGDSLNADVHLCQVKVGTNKNQFSDFMNKKPLPNILTLQQAAEVLNCHPNTLRQWDRKGILPAIRFGKRKDRRYKKEDILRLLDGKE